MRALIVGMGSIGQRHARMLREALGDEVTLSAYRSRRTSPVLSDGLTIEAGVTLVERFGLEEFDTLESALAARPDAVWVCNPTGMHVPVAQRAVDAGCHVFLEKPVSDRLDGVSALAAAGNARRVTIAVGCQLRFHPCLRHVAALLADGAIGRLAAARIHVGEWLPGWHPYEDYRMSYAARRDLGGGVILTLIHEIDYALWLFGAPRRLWCVGGHASRLELDVEDSASILLECTVDGRALPVHVQLDYLQRPPTRGCEIIGDDGRITADLTVPCVRHYAGDGSLVEERVVPAFDRNALFRAELDDFLSCIRTGDRPAVPLSDGVAALRVALAARASLESGQLMELQ